MLFVAPVLIGVLYAFLMSLLREPARRRFNAIMVAGAGPPRPGPPGRNRWRGGPRTHSVAGRPGRYG
ncbi:DUF6010 family protein [Streptomyces mirabilis]|nr:MULTISPECIES: DUF6010 family protein [Streptomyces]